MPPRRGSTTAPPPEEFEENIVDVDVTEEMRGSYLEYAYSVIYSRALPDARDGLKPVQRRILYQMNAMGLRPDRGHVKCARVVGDVMGRLHPHGDGAIYDALVRLAQPWAMRLPLVDGHGNFGSLGGDDAPAAMRYTECRPTEAAMAMVGSIDEDTVDFGPNYDGQEQEPQVLPAAIPNLLVNGTSGIAVGMATNMAPHNLTEVIAAARHLIRHPDASLEQLMRFVPGPDLPTGGRIVGLDGVREAYATGRGIFRTRAAAKIEQLNARKTGIVVTELPYGVGPEKVITRIKDLVQAKKITGISDLKDLTDRTRGLHLVIEVRNGFNPDAVLAELYRLTPMEETFGINNVALLDGQPRVLGLLELLTIYVDHRLEVTRRRSEYRRRKRQERLHLVDGIIVALLNIDEVIQVIRSSDDAAEAKSRLQQIFDLSEIQAQYILDTPLRRLTRYDRLELEREQETLRREIAELTAILEDDGRPARWSAARWPSWRRSSAPRAARCCSKAATRCGPRSRSRWPTTRASWCCPRPACWPASPPQSDDPERSRDDSPAATDRAAHDIVASAVSATARGTIGVVTSAGRMIRLSVLEIPSLPPSDVARRWRCAAAHPVTEFVTALTPGEKVLALVAFAGRGRGRCIGHRQRHRQARPARIPGQPRRVRADHSRPDDSVVGAAQISGDDAELVFITTDAQLLRFPAAAVRPQGRPAGGMAGIGLDAGASVVWFGALGPSAAPASARAAVVVTVAGRSGALPGTGAASVKVTPFAEYPPKGRATGGVRCQRFLKGEGGLIAAWICRARHSAPPKWEFRWT